MKKIYKNADKGIPLNKFIAQSGWCSRRKAEELIRKGLVKVEHEVITEPGMRVTYDARVYINNQLIAAREKYVYIVLNKPKNYITTVSDEAGRKTVLELLNKKVKERIVPVGRLDRMTTGVLLLTNDGELINALTHPKFEVQKRYVVWVDKPVVIKDIQAMIKGIQLEDGITMVDEVMYIPGTKKYGIHLVLHSGKNRIIRRIMESLGYQVKKLDRVDFAGITKKGLKRGEWRYLTQEEVAELKQLKNR